MLTLNTKYIWIKTFPCQVHHFVLFYASHIKNIPHSQSKYKKIFTAKAEKELYPDINGSQNLSIFIPTLYRKLARIHFAKSNDKRTG